MLVVTVTENVRAVQSSYYSSCPWSSMCASEQEKVYIEGAYVLLLLLHYYLPISSSSSTAILHATIMGFFSHFFGSLVLLLLLQLLLDSALDRVARFSNNKLC
jgi:fumarate reductase subunit D